MDQVHYAVSEREVGRDDVAKDDKGEKALQGWQGGGVYRVMGCTGLYSAVLEYKGAYWAELGCTGLY